MWVCLVGGFLCVHYIEQDVQKSVGWLSKYNNNYDLIKNKIIEVQKNIKRKKYKLEKHK